jgi:hypothetical protein
MEPPERAEIVDVKIESLRSSQSETIDNPVLKFSPYASYKARSDRLKEFLELTSISYELAQQLLFSTPRDQLPKVAISEPDPTQMSYSMADRVIESLEMTAAWLRYPEYAKHEDLTVEDVRIRAEEGEFGAVCPHPKDGEPLILWPPEERRPEDFRSPKPGVYTFVGKERLTANVELTDEFDLSDPEQLRTARNLYLRLAHSLGKTEEVASHAKDMLYRSVFLLQWTSFEAFLRETVEALLTKHPQVIVQSAGRKASITYDQIFGMSEQLSSLDNLRRELIELEVQKLRAGDRSIHGLINFLKSAFKLKADPYGAWYVIKGQRREATYNSLMAIKARRNTLVHEFGNIGLDNGAQIAPVTEEEYRDTELALRSVAYSIASSIYNERYEVQPAGGPA